MPDEINPLEDMGVSFVNGDTTKVGFLKMASVGKVKTVFMDVPSDVITFAAVFYVQKLNPDVEVIVWILDEEQAKLFEQLNKERPG